MKNHDKLKVHWLQGLQGGNTGPVATHSQYGAKGQWFTELRIINDKLNMNIDIERWNSQVAPLMTGVMLGGMAMFRDQEDAIGTV